MLRIRRVSDDILRHFVLILPRFPLLSDPFQDGVRARKRQPVGKEGSGHNKAEEDPAGASQGENREDHGQGQRNRNPGRHSDTAADQLYAARDKEENHAQRGNAEGIDQSHDEHAGQKQWATHVSGDDAANQQQDYGDATEHGRHRKEEHEIRSCRNGVRYQERGYVGPFHLLESERWRLPTRSRVR